MATIPTRDDLGGRPVPQAHIGVTQFGSNDVNKAVFDTTTQISHLLIAQQADVDRSKASIAAEQYTTEAIKIRQNVSDRIESGELTDPKSIQQAYAEPLTQTRSDILKNLTPQYQARLGSMFNLTDARAQVEFGPRLLKANQSRQLGNLTTLLDLKQQNLAQPGADVGLGIQQGQEAIRGLGPSAGLRPDQIAASTLKFSQDSWSNDVKQRLVSAQGDEAKLQDLFTQLHDEGGFYLDKIDPEKRVALQSQAQNDILQLQRRTELEADRKEAAAGRTIESVDKQISSTIPATADQWEAWGKQVAGTSYEDQFKTRIAQEHEVQDVVHNLSISQQQGYVDLKQRDLQQHGGSLADQAHVARLSAAVDKNAKELTTDPQAYASRITGQGTTPINLNLLSTPENMDLLHEQFADRLATTRSLQAQHGAIVPTRLLQADEAKQLTAYLDKVPKENKLAIYSGLYQAIGDPAAYVATMGQIAPDSPAKAFAGIRTVSDKKLVLNEGGFFSDHKEVTGPQVASTILAGEEILNKDKAARAVDGKVVGFPLPKEKELREAFTKQVGSAFARSPGVAELAYQAFKDYYTGKTSEVGDLTGDISTEGADERVAEAARAVVGNVLDFHGGGQVIPPWGMGEDEFTDKIQQTFENKAKELGLSQDAVKGFRSYGLQSVGQDQYAVTRNGTYLHDTKGGTVVLNIGSGADIKLDSSGAIQTDDVKGQEIEKGITASLLGNQLPASEAQQGPRGIRNNNPGNIRKSDVPFAGKVDGKDGAFESFATPRDGIHALAVNLLSYQKNHGLNTVEDIIGRWAPPSENNTKSYAKRVATELGVKPGDQLNLSNEDTLSKLTQAIIRHENGKQPYPKKLISDVVAEVVE